MNSLNVPQLRFPGFDGEWIENKLGNLGEFKGGGTPSTTYEDHWNGNIPWISSSDIFEGNLHEINIHRFLNEDAIKESATKIIPANSILLVSRVGVGKLAINKNELCTSQDFCNFIPNKCHSYFVGYFLISKKQILINFSQGTSIKGFTTGDIKTLPIILPTLPEQQKIASFLSAVDEKIQQLSRKKELLSQYKKGVMQQLFSGKLRFKDENGKDYSDWEEKKLGEIGETYNGLTGKTKEDFGKGKPYIQYKQIFDDSKINISRFELVNISTDEKQKKVMFGDVFFTVSSETIYEIGTASVLLDEMEELYLNSFCFGYRANSLKILSPYFSRYLFRSQLFRNKIVKLAQGSTRYNMSKVQLMKLEIQLPCLKEQQKIANFLSGIDGKIEQVNGELVKTQEFKKGLLQQMFV